MTKVRLRNPCIKNTSPVLGLAGRHERKWKTCRYVDERPHRYHRQLMSVFVSAGLISAPGTPCLFDDTKKFYICSDVPHTHATKRCETTLSHSIPTWPEVVICASASLTSELLCLTEGYLPMVRLAAAAVVVKGSALPQQEQTWTATPSTVRLQPFSARRPIINTEKWVTYPYQECWQGGGRIFKDRKL